MELVKSTLGQVTIIRVQINHLDASNVEQFKSALTPAVEKESQVVLDLDSLQFVDSSGSARFLFLYAKGPRARWGSEAGRAFQTGAYPLRAGSHAPDRGDLQHA